MLIGLTGKARSGKSTAAEYLSEEYNTVSFAFADALKKSAVVMFGIHDDYFYSDELKDEIYPAWDMSPREMLQKLGTECIRTLFGEEFWIKRLALEIEPWLTSDSCAGVIISDVRFENEANWIRERGGIIWHVQRDNIGKAVRKHVSENGILFDPLRDKVLENHRTFAELHNRIDSLFTSL